MELQQVEILESDPIYQEHENLDPLDRIEHFRIKYSFDSFTDENELIETAVRKAVEELSVAISYNDSRPYFKKERPNSVEEINSHQTKFFFGKTWGHKDDWEEELGGYCLLNKLNKTVLLAFLLGFYINYERPSLFW